MDPKPAPVAPAEASAPARSRRRTTRGDAGSGSFAVRGLRSPLVGRDAELELMGDMLAQAVDFQAPQALTVVGNQGTGKSRLVVEFIEREVEGRQREPAIRVFQGRAREGGPRYEAIGSLLRDRFDLREGDDAEATLARLRAGVEEAFGGERITEVLHFLGSFLDLHFPDSPFLRVFADSRAQHDEIARTVLRRFFEVDAEAGPVVLVLDDLQWADDATLELLRELAASLGGAPMMLVACTRPDMLVRCPEWGAGADHRRVDLRNLPSADARAMFRHLLGRCEVVPDEVVEDAVGMTGGNPRFLEQLVLLFLDNGTIDTSGDETWRLDPDKAAETELPISIEEAIQARVAALAPEQRELLEKGAVFGNVFWLGAAVALSRIEAYRPTRPRSEARELPAELDYGWTAAEEDVRDRLERAVAELAERDFVLQLDPEDSTIPGEVELVFKHNLERELIVQGTEARRLARYHWLAAQWLETKLAGRSEEQLEFLGQLYERGGDRRRAAHCYLAGGDKARQRYANQEAVGLYTRGLAMLDRDDGLARLLALHNFGDVLERVGRTDEAVACFREMLELAWLFDNRAKAGAAYGRLGRIHRRTGEYEQAMRYLERAHRLFSGVEDRRGIAGTLDDMGKVHWLRGSYQQALEYYGRALEIRRTLRDRRSIALSLANIGRVHRDSGSFKQAIAQLRESLDLRRDIGDMGGVVQSLCDLGGVHLADQSTEIALSLFEEAHGIALEIGDKLAQTEVLSRLGACKSAMGHSSESVQHLRRAIELATELGDRATLSECCRRLAEVYLRAGNFAEAGDEAKRALFISESVGSRVHTGSAHRVLAEALAREKTAKADREAESHFRSALEILSSVKHEIALARAQGAFADFQDRIGKTEAAAELRRQAEAVFARLRGAASID
ncbi:ATP-binding protein [Haliangium sp.]|uniref:ATP-binding protein n=1 Tax=Haliangium sp. TaxID=2663208 RepID=UPI003D147F78